MCVSSDGNAKRWWIVRQNRGKQLAGWETSAACIQPDRTLAQLVPQVQYSTPRSQTWKLYDSWKRHLGYQVDWLRARQKLQGNCWLVDHQGRHALVDCTWSVVWKVGPHVRYMVYWCYTVHHVVWLPTVQRWEWPRNTHTRQKREVRIRWGRMG